MRKVDFIPVDYPEIRAVKSSFKKLLRACVPSDSPATLAGGAADPAGADQRRRGFLKAVEESDWLGQIRSVLQIAGAAVDLLDVQGSSVMICLEDGWDLATQVITGQVEWLFGGSQQSGSLTVLMFLVLMFHGTCFSL